MDSFIFIANSIYNLRRCRTVNTRLLYLSVYASATSEIDHHLNARNDNK